MWWISGRRDAPQTLPVGRVVPMPEPTATAPGTEPPHRFRPRLRFELISCGLYGHELLGTDAAQIRPAAELVVRHAGTGLRWHRCLRCLRCLRCDSWLPLSAPAQPARRFPPAPEHVSLPLRGKALRDKYVLRLIALDRFVHVLLLGMLAAAVFVFVLHRARLHSAFYRIVSDLQDWFGGPSIHHGVLGDVDRAFTLNATTLRAAGLLIAGYGALEAAEGIGLWRRKRWAEYLTFTATTVLLIPEIYELASLASMTKIAALIINLVIVIYLLFAKRLFGLRGGGAAELAQREHDTGWEALRQVLPTGHPADTPNTTPSAGNQ